MNQEKTVAALALLGSVLLFMPHPSAATCIGDCDDDGQVTVDELVKGVGIALGRDLLDQCGVLDQNQDGTVAINELVAAVNAILAGCPVSATATATPTLTSTPTPTEVVPQTTSDIVIRGLVLLGNEYKHQDILVENVGAVTYCQAQAVVSFNGYVHRPSISCRTLFDQDSGSLSSSCLRPGAEGVFSLYYGPTDTPLTEDEIQFQGVVEHFPVPAPLVNVVTINPAPGALPNYTYIVTLINQDQSTVALVLAYAILRDAQQQFLGYVVASPGYPGDFPMGDDRCMLVGETQARYDCIRAGRTKGFGVQKYAEYDWSRVASVGVLPQWKYKPEVTFAPASGTTIHLKAISNDRSANSDAVFTRDGTVFFSETGGGAGGRGINVATIDPTSGVVLELKSYDTWAEYDADLRLVQFLETLPVGTIVMTSVADEASAHLSGASRDDITRLLGSQLIHGLGYWDHWAMISMIGRPVSVSESLVAYADLGTKEADAEWDLSLQ